MANLPPMPDRLPLSASHIDNSNGSIQGSFSLSTDRQPAIESLKDGAWLFNYQTSDPLSIKYDGTIRVDTDPVNGFRVASGDLYERKTGSAADAFPFGVFSGDQKTPVKDIPVFSRSSYKYYLRVTKLQDNVGNSKDVEIEMQMWSLHPAGGPWTDEGVFKATMNWTAAPPSWTATSEYLKGSLKSNTTGRTVGEIRMAWISASFRKATIEIDSALGSPQPLDSGNGQTWQTVAQSMGWELTVIQSQRDIPGFDNHSFSNAELHHIMLQHREHVDLDVEWRFHILIVPFLASAERGIMYDAYATDSNKIAREGIAMSSHWVFPHIGRPNWGFLKGIRFSDAKAPYFRTAIHELGHAMGLFHEFGDFGFMTTSDTIAGAATAASPFPDNIKWNFSDAALRRLRHYPDVFVRAGSVPFGGASESSPPIARSGADGGDTGLALDVIPFEAEVPLGAPVRISIKMTNSSSREVLVPQNLSFKAGNVRGSVEASSGELRTFSPLIRCIDQSNDLLQTLKPGGSVKSDLILLRGGQGALFPSTDSHLISATASWVEDGTSTSVSGSAKISITPPASAADLAAAEAVLAAPDTHLVLVLGGEHLVDGIAAVHSALDNTALRPHYAAIEAKRLLKTTQARSVPAGVAAAESLLREESTVICEHEKRKLAKYLNHASSKHGLKEDL